MNKQVMQFPISFGLSKKRDCFLLNVIEKTDIARTDNFHEPIFILQVFVE